MNAALCLAECIGQCLYWSYDSVQVIMRNICLATCSLLRHSRSHILWHDHEGYGAHFHFPEAQQCNRVSAISPSDRRAPEQINAPHTWRSVRSVQIDALYRLLQTREADAQTTSRTYYLSRCAPDTTVKCGDMEHIFQTRCHSLWRSQLNIVYCSKLFKNQRRPDLHSHQVDTPVSLNAAKR